MTDLTDDQRREVRNTARIILDLPYNHSVQACELASFVLDNVDAPERELSEELSNITEHWEEWTTNTITAKLNVATDCAKQMEHDLAEARAEGRAAHDNWMNAADEVERLTAERDRLEAAQHLSDGSAWGGPVREPTVQKGAESNAESLNPADVKPGEAWRADWCGDQAVAVRTGDEAWPWTVTTFDGYGPDQVKDEAITLVARLVPAPRVITDAKELLSGFSEGTIIRDNTGDIMVRDCDGWTEVNSDEWFVSLPATVLWEPEA